MLRGVQVVDSLRQGHQAMVFVHSRKDTGKTARALVTKAQNAGEVDLFDCSQAEQYAFMAKDVQRSRNRCRKPSPAPSARLVRGPWIDLVPAGCLPV